VQDIRHDLPELEAVKSASASYPAVSALADVIVFALVAGIVAVACWAAAMLWQVGPVDNSRRLAVLAVIAAMVFLIRRSSYFDHTWSTSSAGLSYRGILRSGFIPWMEVTEVKVISPLFLQGERTVIHGRYQKTAVPTHDAVLSASIHQHLMRYGKAGSVPVPREADWLWRGMNVDLPGPVEWVNPSKLSSPIFEKVATVLTAAVTIGIFCRLFLSHAPHWMSSLPILLYPIGWLNSTARQVRRVSVDQDKVEAESRSGTTSMLWDQIKSAGWSGQIVSLHREGKGVVHIPWIPNDRQSTAVLVFIMQHMRSRPEGFRIPVPEQLQLLETYRKLTEQTPEVSH
jgi:hypothetical protein